MSASPFDAALADAVARRVVEMLAQRPALQPWLTPTEVAQLLAVNVDYVYAHAAELGARRLGDGPKARLRFRLEDVELAIPCLAGRGSEAAPTRIPKRKGRPRGSGRLGTNVELLPIRGDRGPP